ncbi:transcriptional regulator [Cupriavidus sp. BIC8F]|uniref:transcriptional regulator n=1 Tax=Cupriavidus sp. BIC8F TaxID=3079014 RepID=UPI0029168372|nr:transcriptional regulator [Cupriavidus sp. BIC8F]
MQQIQLPALSQAELDIAFSSFAGMDGGNPAAAIWVCDAAPLHGYVPLSVALRPQQIPAAWDKAFRWRHAHLLPRWQTHYRIARVLAAARAAALPPGRTPITAQEYFDGYLYAPRGWDFKLSLFPLPERPDQALPWRKVFREQPVLRVKSEYLRLCRLGGRFRFISSLRRQYRPRVVLCLGERHAHDYQRAFGFEDVERNDLFLKPADLARRLQVFEHDQTTLVLSPPFAGAHGLSSDVQLDALGAFLAQWLRPTDFPPRLSVAEQSRDAEPASMALAATCELALTEAAIAA